MKTRLFFAAAVFALAGCASTGGSAPATTAAPAPVADPELDKLVAQAEQEIKLANQTGFLWVRTEDHLKQAKEAKAKGENDKAKKAARKAIKEAQLAQEQAKSQAKPQIDLDAVKLANGGKK
jgi:uncharacterized lipoprotein YajG